MKEIASTEFYSIGIDQAKNRLYLTYKGSWTKPAQVPDFVSDHARACELLSRGFTALIDVRQMESMLLVDYIQRVQADGVRAGIRKAARVYDRPTFIQDQAERIREKTGLNQQSFDSVADAEAWLDE